MRACVAGVSQLSTSAGPGPGSCRASAFGSVHPAVLVPVRLSAPFRRPASCSRSCRVSATRGGAVCASSGIELGWEGWDGMEPERWKPQEEAGEDGQEPPAPPPAAGLEDPPSSPSASNGALWEDEMALWGQNGQPRVDHAEAKKQEHSRSWADAGKPAPGRRTLQNRRRRRRYRQSQRAKRMMAETEKARAFTRWISQMKTQKTPEKLLQGVEEARLQATDTEPILNAINYSAAISALCRLDAVDMASKVLEYMRGDIGLDSVAVAAMLKGLGRSGRLDDAFGLLEEYEDAIHNTAPRHLYMMLLNVCAEAGDVLRARAMMHRISLEETLIRQKANGKVKSTGAGSIRSRNRAYNRTASSPMGGNSAADVPGHRFRIGTFDLSSRLTQYNLLVKAYSNSPNPLEAEVVLKDMQRNGVAPDRVTFNQMMAGMVRSGDPEPALACLQLVEKMKSLAAASQDTSLLPDSISYTCALQAAVRCPAPLMEVQRLLVELEQGFEISMGPDNVIRHRIFPDAGCTSTAVDAMCRLGYPEAGLEYMDKWQTRGQAASPKGIISLMRAYAEKGELEVVRHLHSRLMRYELTSKLPGKLVYEANTLVGLARTKAYRRNAAFNVAMAAEAQAGNREDAY